MNAEEILAQMTPLQQAKYWASRQRHYEFLARDCSCKAFVALQKAVEIGERSLDDGTTWTLRDKLGYRMVPSVTKVDEAGLHDRIRDYQVRTMEVKYTRKALEAIYLEDHPGAHPEQVKAFVDSLCDREPTAPTPILKMPKDWEVSQ